MSVSKETQVFVEESRGLLEDMEGGLLQLETEPENQDLIGSVFRAAHTIKGSAGLFGFDEVVEFTHGVESVLDSVRDGEIAISNELLSLLLCCRDHLVLLVDHAVGEIENLDAEAVKQGQVLDEQLNTYLRGSCTGFVAGSDVQAGQDQSGPAGAVGEGSVEARNWHLSLRFGRDVLRNGMDPLSFIRYLATLGEIVSLTTLCDEIPNPEEMDAESCYLGFEIDFQSEADKQTIEAVFDFVRDDCAIRIMPPHSHISEYIRLINELPEEPMQLGEILLQGGALTERELQEALQHQDSAQASAAKDVAAGPTALIGEIMVAQKVVRPEVVEAALDKQKQAKERKALAGKSIRVSAEKLEQLINQVGELVISGANTNLLASQAGNAELIESMEHMSRLVEDIRDSALGLRMVQINETFNRFRRIVRDVSKEMGKEIELKVSGGDTELDKTVVEKISDPLMHLVRNAIDHGIEFPDVRRQRDKPIKGTLSLNAYHDSGSIVIEVADDGGGLDRDRILSKALERGLIAGDQNLTDRDVYRLIFEPGFSTAEQVTDLSGRGVGMDVVRRNIEGLRGHVEVDSEAGKGSKFTVRLPLTLAIIEGFLVRVGKSSYVIPLDVVEECVELTGANSDDQCESNHISLRGEVLPYVRLRELFRESGDTTRRRENIVVAHFAGQKAGLVVDELLGEYQTVIKPLGRVFQHLKGISGATILGSGEVAMIVDVAALVQQAMARGAERVLRGVGPPAGMATH